jgi:hypothetical protein
MQFLVHALAALALMGLAGLWLIMNLSAQFAHAKRDMAAARERCAGACVCAHACACSSAPGAGLDPLTSEHLPTHARGN